MTSSHILPSGRPGASSSWWFRARSSRYYRLGLSVVSGLLLAAGWPMSPLPFLLFVALVPLLEVERHIAQVRAATGHPRRPGRVFFGYVYLAMLLFNALTTWWVSNSTLTGGIFAVIANAALMSVPWVLFRLTLRRTNPVFGYVSLLFYQIGFEFLHLNWDLSWPWLTLGNGLAAVPAWVQWYEYTGALGGTLWTMGLNLLLFFCWHQDRRYSRVRTLDVFTLLVLLVPLGYSYWRYLRYENQGPAVEMVVVQPNIDPYTEKFIGSENHIPVPEQIARFAQMAETMITPETRYVIWPETAVDGALPEERIEQTPEMRMIREFVARHPHVTLITGLTTYVPYGEVSATPTARYREGFGYYDVFNTAAQIRAGQPAYFYHKSRLVPGVEIMPYPKVFKFLSALVIDLGGTSGGLGRQPDRTVFFSNGADSTDAYNGAGRYPGGGNDDMGVVPEGAFAGRRTGVAPVICYESIYGDFVSDYIRQRADYIAIITNDGWWGPTPGHRQHLAYGALRAIEMRRSIARSANTGISAFVDQRGDIYQATEYWEPAVIRGAPQANDELTFYAENGDYLGRVFGYTAPFFLLAVLVKARTDRSIVPKRKKT